MISKELADFVKDFSNTFPNTVDRFKKEAGEGIGSFLKRQGLVTREEFEAQKKVLARCQEKLQQLEKKLSLLEKN